MSLKLAILEAQDLPLEKLWIPEWNTHVWVKTLSAQEYDDFRASTVKFRDGVPDADLDNTRARLAVKVICDEDGNRIFSDADAATLGRKSSRAIERICTVANRLNAIDEDAVAEEVKN